MSRRGVGCEARIGGRGAGAGEAMRRAPYTFWLLFRTLLVLGIAAAVLAMLPVLLSPSAQISYFPLGATLALVFLSGLFWTWAAARLALRGELLPALRNE